VDIKTGLLVMPGVLLGGIIGGRIATHLSAARMRRVFAAILFTLGIWVFASGFYHGGAASLH